MNPTPAKSLTGALLVFGTGATLIGTALGHACAQPGIELLTPDGRQTGLALSGAGFLAITLGLIGLFLELDRVATQTEAAWLAGRGRPRPHGLRIVAIGGGTGLSCLVRGLKAHTSNITAIVTVADDGGSSGRLRRDFNILPPGDARNCIAALARNEDLLSQLFQYRYGTDSELSGHSFGNLFIAALAEITGDFLEALRLASDVLAISGEVLPSTLDNVVLCADLESGEHVEGESRIPVARQRIRKISLSPPNPSTPPVVLDRLASADLVVLGPGSFFTSIVPNLLVGPLTQALNAGRAPVVYVSNLMSQPGETDRFGLGDYVEAIHRHTPLTKLDFVIANNAPIEEVKLRFYQSRGSTVTDIDRKTRILLGGRLVETDLVPGNQSRRVDVVIRHDPDKLAKAIIELARLRAGS